MGVTRERFEQGMTYQQYKDQMTRNRERVDTNEQNVTIAPADLAAFKAIKTVHVVALAEDWCGDVIANLPVLGRLARESGTLDVHVFLRDQNEDLTMQYLNKGQFKSIPVFAFFDDDFREIGHWIERPDSVTRLRAEKRKAIYAAHPEFGDEGQVDQLSDDLRAKLQAEIQKMREETTPFANAEVVRELRALVTRTPTPA